VTARTAASGIPATAKALAAVRVRTGRHVAISRKAAANGVSTKAGKAVRAARGPVGIGRDGGATEPRPTTAVKAGPGINNGDNGVINPAVAGGAKSARTAGLAARGVTSPVAVGGAKSARTAGPVARGVTSPVAVGGAKSVRTVGPVAKSAARGGVGMIRLAAMNDGMTSLETTGVGTSAIARALAVWRPVGLGRGGTATKETTAVPVQTTRPVARVTDPPYERWRRTESGPPRAGRTGSEQTGRPTRSCPAM
jgi:hypothetical protein